MAGWRIFAARGILSKGKFDPAQIEEALAIGLEPQVILTPNAQNPDIIRDMVAYLKHKELCGVPVKLTSHGKGEFRDDADVKNVLGSIDAIVALNKAAGMQVISEVVFHAGAVQSFAEGFRIKQERYFGGIDAAFTARDYSLAIEAIRDRIGQARRYGQDNDVQVIIENVGQVNFGVVPSQKLEDKPAELRSDSRWGDTIWLPEAIQLGDVGCVHDLDYLTRGEGPVCIDVEHLDQSVEYSKTFNMGNIPFRKGNGFEKDVLEKFGVFVIEGSPVLYERVVYPVAAILKLQGRIPICHIGGQVKMFYKDNGVIKIGSHMPVTFGDQANEFIDDDALRLEHNRLREEKLKMYLSALHDAGCRQGVLELHIGEIYVGEKWRHYNKVSLDNVRSIVDRF